MHAFSTSCRRAVQFGFAAAFCVACATYVDQAPNAAGVAGSAGAAGSDLNSPPEIAGSGGTGGAPSGGSAGMPQSSGGGGVAAAGTANGGASGSAGHAGSSGTAGAGGSAGVSGSGGAAGAGGVSGASGSAGGGMGGTAAGGNGGTGGVGGSGGNGGLGGAGATTCAKNPITAKTKWTVTASSSDGPAPPSQACDNMVTTRWTTGKEQAGSEWLQVDFGAVVKLSKLTLVLGSSPNDYPRKYATRFANTPPNSSAPVLVSGMGAASTDTVMTFPAGATGRYVLINQSGVAPALWWSVAEIQAECAD